MTITTQNTAKIVFCVFEWIVRDAGTKKAQKDTEVFGCASHQAPEGLTLLPLVGVA